MSNEEKIESGKYGVYRKQFINIGTIVSLISIIAFVGQSAVYSVRMADKTFDTQVQKVHTIDHPQTYHITKSDVVKIESSIENNTIEIIELKKMLQKVIENQIKIGQDLEQLKRK